MTNAIRNIAVLLVIIVSLATAVSLNASNADADPSDFTVEIINDYAFITGYTGDSGTITIPETMVVDYKEVQIYGIKSEAFENNKLITEVTIPSGIELISDNAFNGCSNLKYLTIEGSPVIGTSAFMYCSSLEFIDIKGTPEISGKTTFMLGKECTVRTSSEGILDEYSANTEFTYIEPQQTIVRFVSSTAPADASFPDFIVTSPGSKVTSPEGSAVQGYDMKMYVGESEVTDSYRTPATDVTITIVYQIQSYTVNFTVDGETYQTYRFDYGETVTAPTEDPVKEQDERNTYEFTGWNGFTDGMTVTGDMTFEAQFSPSDHEYTITFKVDGETVQEMKLKYGETVIAPAEAPEKDGFEFTGWSGYEENMTVTGDMTFEAQFQEIPQDDGSGDDTMLYAGAAVAIVIVIILALLLLRRFL